jgi:hypothetical protein
MKTLTRSTLAALLLLFVISAYADSMVLQKFDCEFNGDATADQVLKTVDIWLGAAKKMKGGANMSAGVRFPIAEGADSEVDFVFVISTPTFAEWGAFTDAYEGSAASKVDEQLFDLADCGSSTLWEGMVFK